ncbi:hypothetical protein BDF14DRAFT_1819893 [Spinellus fusiger]|nr:hypothetical protein BDF14DRAFT_1819893 [Spinellus fusiger]
MDTSSQSSKRRKSRLQPMTALARHPIIWCKVERERRVPLLFSPSFVTGWYK